MSPFWNWTFGLTLVALMIAVPTVHYRSTYAHNKRLRPVAEGKLYRSGTMTANGLREAIAKHKIKTVINLQDEAQDPELRDHYFTLGRTTESELLKSLDVKYIYFPCELVYPRDYGKELPATIKNFLDVMDDPANYPVLLHCRAGLHRTGSLVAMYRQEYDGWSAEAALRELKNHGFGEFFSTSANPYIVQYILSYQPRRTGKHADARSVPGALTNRTNADRNSRPNEVSPWDRQLPPGPP